MIVQTNIGTNDLVRAEAFYSQLLPLFGAEQIYKTERSLVYAFGGNGARLAVNIPFNGEPANAGNGCMVALGASGPEQVKAVHAKALELGGRCEGPPGERYDGRLYAAYFRDPEGNKFGLLYMAG